MSTLSRLTARLAAVASFAALLATACNIDSSGPSSPMLSAHGQGGGGGGAASGFAVLGREAVSCTDGTIVGDVTTKPEITPFLAAARERGCAVLTGRDMVEGQLAAIFRFFGFELDPLP